MSPQYAPPPGRRPAAAAAAAAAAPSEDAVGAVLEEAGLTEFRAVLRDEEVGDVATLRALSKEGGLMRELGFKAGHRARLAA
eukprot:gene36317-50153_t